MVFIRLVPFTYQTTLVLLQQQCPSVLIFIVFIGHIHCVVIKISDENGYWFCDKTKGVGIVSDIFHSFT